MAKVTTAKALKKGKATFNLIGKTKVTDKTFNLDNTYDSGWTDNSMYVGIDCGNGNVVYAEMRSGFFPDKDNVIRAYSKDEKDDKGKSKSVEIAWEDRENEDLFDTISNNSFITVGVEKDIHDKTVYKKFLTSYDAVQYISEHLESDMIVNVKGNIKYSEYDDSITAKKEITSIVLSRVEKEEDFKSVFEQTILVDSASIGKKDAEKNTMELSAYVVDYIGSPKINGKKVIVKKNVTFPKSFEVAINDNAEITAKMLQKYFKVRKKGSINELTVTGNLIEGAAIVNITDDDIPDDIKELIEMGIYTEEEAKNKCAIGNNNNREKRMVILRPSITYVGDGDDRKPTVAVEEAKYVETDLYFYEQALNDAGVENSSVEKTKESTDTEEDSEEDELLKMLDNM